MAALDFDEAQMSASRIAAFDVAIQPKFSPVNYERVTVYNDGPSSPDRACQNQN
jgi:hypothetical protein